MVERFYDYVAQTGTLAASALSAPLQIRINPDAPFLARGRAAQIDGHGPNINFNLFSSKWADAHGRYRSNDFLSAQADLPASEGELTTPLVPEVVFPPNSNLEFQVRNDWIASLGFTLLWRGVTLHPEGSVYAPPLPERFEVLRFRYTLDLQITRGAAATLLNDQFLQVQPDSGFLITDCFLESDITQGLTGFKDLRVRIKDRLGKYYSNDYVPVNLVLGTDQAQFGGPQGTNEEAKMPEVWYPGIYLEANDYLGFDFQLNDTGGAATLFFQLVLKGYKVFRR